MIFHVHYSSYESSGEIRRIRNINRDLVTSLSTDVIEIAFISSVCFFKGKYDRFRLQESVKKKFYFPCLPFSYGNLFFKKLDGFWTSFLLGLLYLVYRPKYIVSEYSISSRSLKLIPQKVPCIIDVHGAVREEYEYSVPNPRKAMSRYYDFLERSGSKRAYAIVCQSEAMRKHLVAKYPGLDEQKICVYRCAADEKMFFYDEKLRNAKRKELQIGNQELFVYSGGLHRWQKIEDALRLFRDYLSYGSSVAKFLILTLDRAAASSLVELKFPEIRKNIIIKSVPHTQVGAYLCAADVAFLLRDNVIMNVVAFPTKLAEYMACGLPIISNCVAKNWVDCPEFIYDIDAKKIENLKSFLETIDRVKISNFAHEHLSLDSDRRSIKRFLDGLAQ